MPSLGPTFALPTIPRSRIPARTLAHLFALAGGICSFEGCRQELVLSDASGYSVYDIADVAHVIAHSPAGPRGDEPVSREERAQEANLMLLCPNHHKVVDKDPRTYSVDTLRQMKDRHQRVIQNAIQKAMLSVTLVEIEEVAQHLIATPSTEPIDFRVIPPSEKIAKNSLTAWPREQLTLGIPRAREVARYLSSMARTDPEFPERVKAGFVSEYRKLWAAGLRSDDLFQGMFRFATAGASDYKRMVAGIAILAYLFEACEVFES
jgi:hypothetical protein